MRLCTTLGSLLSRLPYRDGKNGLASPNHQPRQRKIDVHRRRGQLGFEPRVESALPGSRGQEPSALPGPPGPRGADRSICWAWGHEAERRPFGRGQNSWDPILGEVNKKPPIVEPILVVGLGYWGYDLDFEPWPNQVPLNWWFGLVGWIWI